jgi:hypothetical protein
MGQRFIVSRFSLVGGFIKPSWDDPIGLAEENLLFACAVGDVLADAPPGFQPSISIIFILRCRARAGDASRFSRLTPPDSELTI